MRPDIDTHAAITAAGSPGASGIAARPVRAARAA